jgi:hypothetical protein
MKKCGHPLRKTQTSKWRETYIYICMCMHEYLCIHKHTHIQTCIHKHIHIQTCIHSVYVSVYAGKCAYVYTTCLKWPGNTSEERLISLQKWSWACFLCTISETFTCSCLRNWAWRDPSGHGDFLEAGEASDFVTFYVPHFFYKCLGLVMGLIHFSHSLSKSELGWSQEILAFSWADSAHETELTVMLVNPTISCVSATRITNIISCSSRSERQRELKKNWWSIRASVVEVWLT